MYISELFISEIGKHNNLPDSMFNQKQLTLGIETEKEHTNDPEEAKSISKDHLVELPNTYYSRLKKMEKQGKKDDDIGIKIDKED